MKSNYKTIAYACMLLGGINLSGCFSPRITKIVGAETPIRVGPPTEYLNVNDAVLIVPDFRSKTDCYVIDKILCATSSPRQVQKDSFYDCLRDEGQKAGVDAIVQIRFVEIGDVRGYRGFGLSCQSGIQQTQQAPILTGIQWVSIPGGTFTMRNGDTFTLGDDRTGETTSRREVIIKPFEMAKTVVTNKQYKACVAAGACTAAHVSDGTCEVGSTGKGNLPDSFQNDDQPVVCVDWEQARRFSEWIGGRLPSEAEWEYAARSGGKDWKYPWRNEEWTCEFAVLDDGEGTGCGRHATWPVCSKTKGNTEQGLCDMAGNAMQWVQDWYHGSNKGAPTDGSAWESPPVNSSVGLSRIVRGNSWRERSTRATRAWCNNQKKNGAESQPACQFVESYKDSDSEIGMPLPYQPNTLDDGLGFRPAR